MITIYELLQKCSYSTVLYVHVNVIKCVSKYIFFVMKIHEKWAIYEWIEILVKTINM